jgi:endonuclease/exonuclease/phosphatase family metal-dependent hydrolase
LAALLLILGAAGCAAAGLWASPAGAAWDLDANEPACMIGHPASEHAIQGPDVAWVRTSARDQLVLDAWCEAVGPVHASLGEPDAPVAPVDSLVVLTWNVHVGGGDVIGLVTDLRAGALTGGHPVESFVLLLQEAHRAGREVPASATPGAYGNPIAAVPPSGERLDIVEAARGLGLNVLYAPSMRNGVGSAVLAEDRGNAIVTSLPITDPAAIELPFERQRRVAVAGTVRGVTPAGESWSLRLVSAHLENRSKWTRALDSFGASRERQARALLGAIDGAAAVVGADLNTWSPGFLESALGILREQLPDGPPFSAPTMNVGGIPRQLDHLLFRVPDGWQVSLERVNDRYGSDHHPVLGVVRL